MNYNTYNKQKMNITMPMILRIRRQIGQKYLRNLNKKKVAERIEKDERYLFMTPEAKELRALHKQIVKLNLKKRGK